MKLMFITKRDEQLPLIGNDNFFLTELDGQTRANADLTSVVTGGIDGDTVTNAQAQPRLLTFNLRIKNGVNVEEAKRQILRFIKLKQEGRILWEQNDRSVIINGIVESIDMPRYTNAVVLQVSLHCEQPFWEDVEFVIQVISQFINMHYFTNEANDMLYFPVTGIPLGRYDTTRTKAFNNEGNVEVGITIEINALRTVTNPKIYDTNGNFFGLGSGTGNKKVVLNAGDKVVITTHKGNKTVAINGVSAYGKIAPNSTWLQLQTGDNQFRITSEDTNADEEPVIDNMNFNLTYKQRYI